MIHARCSRICKLTWIVSAQSSIKKAVEEQGRNGNPAASSDAKYGGTETLNQPSSPIKIPTGPRADRAPPIRQAPPSIRASTRPQPAIIPGRPRPNTLTWTNPNLQPRAPPRGPSIMNTVPTKRDFVGEEKARRLQSATEHSESGTETLRRDSMNSQLRSDNLRDARDQKDVSMDGTTDDEANAANLDVDSSKPKMLASELVRDDDEDESGAEDADMDFDERDFAEAEKKFERDMQALEAKQPPTPRSNGVLMDLLEELDALASALEDQIRNGLADEAIKAESTTVLGLPSPKVEEGDHLKESVRDTSPALALRTRPQTPPIDSLPFLASGPPTPFSELEGMHGDSEDLAEVKFAIAQRCEKEQSEIKAENDLVRENFARQYKPWRMDIEDFEEAKANRDQQVANMSPPPDPAPPNAQTTPSLGRRRGVMSEYTFQNVIKESEETAAREEQQRREREERIYTPPETFNDQREAVIPDMLNIYEAKDSLFADKNTLIPSDQALAALVYYPKKDDFNAEEHKMFEYWYMHYPKRFGEIAARLEHKNYQDCVQHYYSTKIAADYKAQEVAFFKTKRGRRFVASHRAAARGQANSLMNPAFDGSVDQEAQQTALTEKGRPRRAAAPTFGDNADTEASNPAATPARRGANGKESIPGSAEKTTGKRTRQVSAKEKPGRKPKAQQPLAVAPAPTSLGLSPQKPDLSAAKYVGKTALAETNQRFDELETAQVLAGLTKGPAFGTVLAQRDQTESWPINQPLMTQTNQRRAPSEGFNTEHAQPTSRRHAGDQTAAINSYWLVSENLDLRNYLSYFGTDWQAIADNIPSKTANMVNLVMLVFSLAHRILTSFRSKIDTTS